MKQIWISVLVALVILLAAGSPGVADPDNKIQTAAVNVPVTPAGTGFYDFRCNIEGAMVYLDDSTIGEITNGTLVVSLPVFDHPYKRLIRMEAPGYTTYNETLLTSPKPGETMVVRGNLRMLPFNLTGTISLAVSPPGSEVRIDGIVAGVIPESGIITFRSVKSGNRNIRVAKAGYEVYSNITYIEANMISKLRIALTPLTTGTLLITSNPSGAQVTINGTPFGVSPVTAPDLKQGVYTIGYRLQGYQPSMQKVNLTAGQSIPVACTLQPLPTPTPTLATPMHTPSPEPTQAGIPYGIVIAGLLAGIILIRKK